MENRNFNVYLLCLIKDNEKYAFIFDKDSRADTLRTLGRYASNPELSFSWNDAAILSNAIRKKFSDQEIQIERNPKLVFKSFDKSNSYKTLLSLIEER